MIFSPQTQIFRQWINLLIVRRKQIRMFDTAELVLSEKHLKRGSLSVKKEITSIWSTTLWITAINFQICLHKHKYTSWRTPYSKLEPRALRPVSCAKTKQKTYFVFPPNSVFCPSLHKLGLIRTKNTGFETLTFL